MIAKEQMPSRWVVRLTGAMKVYSMVPSQRSHAMAKDTSKNISDR
jgi:hypothetical protein